MPLVWAGTASVKRKHHKYRIDLHAITINAEVSSKRSQKLGPQVLQLTASTAITQYTGRSAVSEKSNLKFNKVSNVNREPNEVLQSYKLSISPGSEAMLVGVENKPILFIKVHGNCPG